MLAWRLFQQTTQKTSFFMTRRSTHACRCPQFLTSRLHKRRPISAGQGLIITLTNLISLSALLLLSPPTMVSQALACLPAPSQPSRNSCPKCPGISPTVSRTCRSKSVISVLPLPPLHSGCENSKRRRSRSTRLLPTSVQTSLHLSPLQCPLPRQQVLFLTSPCQSPQDQQDPCHTGGRPRASLPASVRGCPTKKKHKTSF